MARELSDEEVFGPQQPRGVRNNNPLNVKASVPWSGMTGRDGEFAQFASLEDGYRAADRNLQTYGEKHGINTVGGVVNRWAPPNADGNHTGAYVQHVAGRMGVDPNAQIDLVNPATRQALLGAMAEFENGGPVGMPQAQPQVEMSDEEVFGAPGPKAGDGSVIDAKTGEALTPAQTQFYQSYAIDRTAKPGSQAFPLGQRRAEDIPEDGQWYVDLEGNLKRAGGPTMLEDAASGFAQPFQDLGHEVMEGFRKTEAGKPLDFDFVPRVAGAALNTLTAPLQAAARPAARALAKVNPLDAYDRGAVSLGPNGLSFGAPRKMSADQEQAMLEGALMTAATSGRPALGRMPSAVGPGLSTSVPGKNLTQQIRAVAPQMPVKPPKQAIPARLKAEKNAAYSKVDGSGFTFAQQAVKDLADALEAAVRAKGGPKAAKASPQADSMIGRVRALAGQQGGVTLSQLDRVRSDVWPLMMEGGGPDSVYGSIIRSGIDDLISKQNAPFIKEARAANTRWSKANEVANRLRSAQLQAGRANSGENLGNAIRQKFSPMIDPMHSGQVENFTPAEAAAIEKIVVGDKTQNALRTWSNRLRNPMWTGTATTPAALMGFAAGGPVGGAGAAGLTAAAMQGAGQALRGAAEARTVKNAEKLLELIAGKTKAKPKGRGRGLIGGAAVVRPLVQREDDRRSKR